MNEQKTITIKEALGFPEGTPIPRITGKVTHIFDRKTGEGDFGPYSSQSGVIEDNGDKILFTVWNKPEIPHDYKGRVVIFRAGSGKKPSMTLKSDFKDSSKRTLNVTKSCIMLTEDEETDDIPMDYPATSIEGGDNATKSIKVVAPKSMESIAGSMMAETLQRNAPKANVAPNKAIPANGVQEVKHRVMQLANLREICDHAAGFLYPDTSSVGLEYVKDIATSLFIQACRENLHDKLPNNRPLSKKENVEAVEPDSIPEEF